MGYTFKIGNLITTTEIDDDEAYTSYDTESLVLDDAPEFPNDELTGKSNSRSPSYSTWSNFCKDTGIYYLFYNVSGHLHGGHPGYTDITKDMVDHIKLMVERWKSKSKLPPGFEGFPIYDPLLGDYVTPDEGKYDHMLARLLWLEFWTNWALENCEKPAIVNW